MKFLTRPSSQSRRSLFGATSLVRRCWPKARRSKAGWARTCRLHDPWLATKSSLSGCCAARRAPACARQTWLLQTWTSNENRAREWLREQRIPLQLWGLRLLPPPAEEKDNATEADPDAADASLCPASVHDSPVARTSAGQAKERSAETDPEGAEALMCPATARDSPVARTSASQGQRRRAPAKRPVKEIVTSEVLAQPLLQTCDFAALPSVDASSGLPGARSRVPGRAPVRCETDPDLLSVVLAVARRHVSCGLPGSPRACGWPQHGQDMESSCRASCARLRCIARGAVSTWTSPPSLANFAGRDRARHQRGVELASPRVARDEGCEDNGTGARGNDSAIHRRVSHPIL